MKPTYDLVLTNKEAVKALELIKESNPSVIGLDSETAWWKLGAAYEHTSIIQMAVPIKERIKIFIFDCLADDDPIKMSNFEELLSGPTIKAIHNASYDIRLIYKSFGILMKNIWCTLEAERRLCKQEKIKKSLTLEAVALERLGIKMIKDDQASSWESRPLSQSQLIYAANDALTCFRLYEMQKALELDGSYFYIPELAQEESSSLIEEEEKIDSLISFLKTCLMNHRALRKKVTGFDSFRGRRVEDVMRFFQELLKMMRLIKADLFLSENATQEQFSLCVPVLSEAEVFDCVERLRDFLEEKKEIE